MKWYVFLSLALLLTLSGCGGKRLEESQDEGEGLLRSIARELSYIHGREELLEKSELLRGQYQALVEVLIWARERQDRQKSPTSIWSDGEAATQLRFQLNRLCQMEGVQELLAEIQDPALQRLDSHSQLRSLRQSRRK